MYAKIGTACISLTQNVQKSEQVLDKVRARRIIVRSFVRSFVRSRNSCPKHKIRKTIKQSRPHEPAAKKGFRASLVQNFLRARNPICAATIVSLSSKQTFFPFRHAMFSVRKTRVENRAGRTVFITVDKKPISL